MLRPQAQQAKRDAEVATVQGELQAMKESKAASLSRSFPRVAYEYRYNRHVTHDAHAAQSINAPKSPANITKNDIMPEAAPLAAAVSVKKTHTSSAHVVAARRPTTLTATNLPKSSPKPHM